MKRKVIQIAGSTQLVSLPRKWAQKYKIKKGDELEVAEQANKLTISTEKSLDVNKITIDAKGMDSRMMRWSLTAAYQGGYDEIEVLFDDPKVMDTTQARIQELLGFVVIEHSSNRCLIKSISHGIEQEFDSTLRRSFLVTLSMGRSIYDILKKGDNAHLKETVRLESTNNQLVNFCQRVLNKRGYKDSRKTTYLYVILSLIEAIGDSYKWICLYITNIPENKKHKVSNETLRFLNETNDFFEMFYKIFYNHDEKLISKISDTRWDFPQKAFNIMKKKSPVEISIVHFVLDIYFKILDAMDPYMGTRY